MEPTEPPSDMSPVSQKEAEQGERWELLGHIQGILEPVMAVLGIVFLGLLLMDYAAIDIGPLGPERLARTLQIIWAIFLADFALRFFIAPAKLPFLTSNWLAVLSLALPFLRPLRAFRAARAIRSMSLVRFVGGINRGIRVLRQVTRGAQFAYVGVLTIFVVLAGAIGVRFFDRGIEGASIQTFGDALWWSAALVTTINSELYVVSGEARVLAILQRVYAVSIFGFITASIASYLVGHSVNSRQLPGNESTTQRELAALREEVAALRQGLALPNENRQGNVAGQQAQVDDGRATSE